MENTVTKNQVSEFIARLLAANISMAKFERTFNLPKRTLARWKKGNCSASGMALLQIVCAYPWLIDLAEGAYDLNVAQHLLVKNASFVLKKEVEI